MPFNRQAKRQIREAKEQRTDIQRSIDTFKYGQNTQGLENPFADATNVHANTTNPFAGQQVALQAADYQTQATNRQLANTLDTVTQAGGNAAAAATSLARASQDSNQQIAAGIEQQERQNQQLSAQGEQRRQELFAQGEQQRQQLYGQGQQYILGLQEQRDQQTLQGYGNQFAAAQQSINSGYESIASTNAAVIGAIGNIASAFVPKIPGLGKLPGS